MRVGQVFDECESYAEGCLSKHLSSRIVRDGFKRVAIELGSAMRSNEAYHIDFSLRAWLDCAIPVIRVGHHCGRAEDCRTLMATISCFGE